MKQPQNLHEWAGASKLNICVLLTDIIGSTSLAAHHGDDAWTEMLIKHFERVRELRSQFDSFEIKLIGDAYMAVFRTAEAALEFGEGFVLSPGPAHIEIRVAIHLGPVRIIENDIYGLMVNKTQRLLSALGDSAGIVVSGHAYSAIVSSFGKVGYQYFTTSIADLRSFGKEIVYQYIKPGYFDLLKARHSLIELGRPFTSDILPPPRSSKLPKGGK